MSQPPGHFACKGQGAGGILVWTSGGDLRPVPDRGESLLAADSWLVADGRARALDRHRARFRAACAEALRGSFDIRPDRWESELEAFWEATILRIPGRGRWFPRVELVRHPGGPVLRARLRPAPGLGVDVQASIFPGRDPRRFPRRKGPDLDRLGRVRQLAAGVGADDALFTTRTGIVTEATTCNVLWWEDECLCLAPPHLRVLPGITSSLVVDRAAELGIPVRYRYRRVEDLDGCEVWLVNALHGIRPLTGWVGTAVTPGPARLAGSWRTWLTGLMRPLPLTV